MYTPVTFPRVYNIRIKDIVTFCGCVEEVEQPLDWRGRGGVGLEDAKEQVVDVLL